MKKKVIATLICINCLFLLLSGCGQKDIGEAKAKEIGLNYINQIFDVNETEAIVQRYVEECIPENDGAVVTGDPNIGTRVLYNIVVANNDSQSLYEAWVVGSSGKLYSARQSMINIVLTDEQKQKAKELSTEKMKWVDVLYNALRELKLACHDWAIANLDEPRPTVLEANRGKNWVNTKQREFSNEYYVVTRDGRVYYLSMSWPSMQILSISVENEP